MIYTKEETESIFNDLQTWLFDFSDKAENPLIIAPYWFVNDYPEQTEKLKNLCIFLFGSKARFHISKIELNYFSARLDGLADERRFYIEPPQLTQIKRLAKEKNLGLSVFQETNGFLNVTIQTLLPKETKAYGCITFNMSGVTYQGLTVEFKDHYKQFLDFIYNETRS